MARYIDADREAEKGRWEAMRCFYCGKRETYRNPFYNLDKDGHKICQSCMREGYTKSALEIIEHNKQVDMRKEDEGK